MNYNNITISGQICTGKTVLRNLLSKKLGWQIFSTGELFRQYVKKHKLSLELADEQNNHLTKKIDGHVTNLLKTKTHFIVDSWMAGLTAKNVPRVLKVLLICRDDIRYKRFAKREKITCQEAKNKVEKRFINWSKKIKKIYKRRDYFNHKHFHLIINTSSLDPLEVVGRVLDKLGYKNSH